MQRHRSLRTGIFLGGLMLLVVVGFATAQSVIMPASGDVVADRQRLMRLNGASWADIQAKTKAGNIEAIAVNAETIALIADQVSIMFPEGSLTPKSNAKPEVWQKFSEFQATAKTMGTLAAQLRDAAKAKDAATVETMVKDFGKNACGACHTPFRVPPKA
jgi:cytochrome c556